MSGCFQNVSFTQRKDVTLLSVMKNGWNLYNSNQLRKDKLMCTFNFEFFVKKRSMEKLGKYIPYHNCVRMNIFSLERGLVQERCL